MNGDTMSAAMWLHLLKSRKTVNAAAMAQAFNADRKLVDKLLSSMASRGTIRSSHDPARKDGRAYSVDAACAIPRGLTMAKVLEAVDRQDAMPKAPEVEIRAKVRILAPRGQLGQIGRVSSVFALGQQ